MGEASWKGLIFKCCLLLLFQTSAACFIHSSERLSLPLTQLLLNTLSVSLSTSAKGLVEGSQIMCLFFPGHPPLILSSKSIYLPCKVLIDRELERSEWCQLKTSLSKQSSHASPWSPQAEPKAECVFLSQPQGLIQGLPLLPPPTAFVGRWFFKKQMLVVEAWNSTAQPQEVCSLIQPKNNFIGPPRESLPHLHTQTLSCYALGVFESL